MPRFEPLAAQMMERAERLEHRECVDGIHLSSLVTFEEFLSALWKGWTVAAREDATVQHSQSGRWRDARQEGPSSLVATIVLRHDNSGVWITGQVTLTYWSRPGVVHMGWDTMSDGGRLHAVATHLLNKSVDAPTLTRLLERVGEEIERRVGGGAREVQRHARCARLLLNLDPKAVADAVAHAVGDDGAQALAHEVVSMHTLAGLGALGDIHARLHEADLDTIDLY